ncbi:MAG: universal stress protein [Ectothiorhodospiraceae bacterium]|nr:universal stress protein [Ectothiorhodospiraceae bacterium]
MFSKILVATDPAHGDETAHALTTALRLLDDEGEILLFAVVGPRGTDFFPHVPDTTPDAEDQAVRDKLDVLARKFLPHQVTRRILIAHGNSPGEAIVEAADQDLAALIILVSHGAGGRWPWPRHTVEYVSVNAPCAALILRQPDA